MASCDRWTHRSAGTTSSFTVSTKRFIGAVLLPRRALAPTLTPRSWPSSPTFAGTFAGGRTAERSAASRLDPSVSHPRLHRLQSQFAGGHSDTRHHVAQLLVRHCPRPRP